MSPLRTGLAVTLFATACTVSPAEPPPDSHGVVRVPIALEDGMAWLDAKVGGKPVRLLLDLGGFDAVSLVPDAIKDLDVEWTGRTRTVFSAMGEAVRSREYVLPEVEIAGIIFRDVKGHEDLLQVAQQAVPRQGYVGLGLLRRFRIVIDYRARVLVLVWPDVQAPPEYEIATWPRLDFAAESDGVVARARLAGEDRLFVWDTGASHCVLKSGLEGGAEVTTKGGHKFVTVGPFEAGGDDLGPMEFALLAFKQPKADGFMGYPFFVKHAVYVDFKRRQFAIRP